MIPDADIRRAALLMTRCFRREADSQAETCADDLAASDADEASMWRRIAAAVEQLPAGTPGEGEAVH